MTRMGMWAPVLLLLGCGTFPEQEANAEPWQPPIAFLPSGYYTEGGLSRPGIKLRDAITKALEKEWPLWKVREYSVEKYRWDPDYLKPKAGVGWRADLHADVKHDAGRVYWYAGVDEKGDPQEYRLEIEKEGKNWTAFGHIDALFPDGRRPRYERAFRQEASADFVVTFDEWERTYVYRPKKTDGKYMRELTWDEALGFADERGIGRTLAVVVFGKGAYVTDAVLDRKDEELRGLGFRHVIFQRHVGKRVPDGRPIYRE